MISDINITTQKTWLITGVAGFIGSHLVETLLEKQQSVVGLDNLSTGHTSNISNALNNPDFTFIEGDIRDPDICLQACTGADFVLHHAAVGSVVKSLEYPILTDDVNNGGFLHILNAARKHGIKRVVYASSSAVYGNTEGTAPQHEALQIAPLSPYAASKCANEAYAKAYAHSYSMEIIGLRYFNIYGPRQDPEGAYAAVIPKWITQMIEKKPVTIHGDGTTIRDFCAVQDVARANIAASLCDTLKEAAPIYNIASGQRTSLNDLFMHIKNETGYTEKATYGAFREADIKISSGNITKAKEAFNLPAPLSLEDGLKETVAWYRDRINA